MAHDGLHGVERLIKWAKLGSLEPAGGAQHSWGPSNEVCVRLAVQELYLIVRHGQFLTQCDRRAGPSFVAVYTKLEPLATDCQFEIISREELSRRSGISVSSFDFLGSGVCAARARHSRHTSRI